MVFSNDYVDNDVICPFHLDFQMYLHRIAQDNFLGIFYSLHIYSYFPSFCLIYILYLYSSFIISLTHLFDLLSYRSNLIRILSFPQFY